jgi:hypothetical protein
MRYPRGGRVAGGTEDPDPAAGVLDHCEHVPGATDGARRDRLNHRLIEND